MLGLILYVTFLDSKKIYKLYFSVVFSLYIIYKINLLHNLKKCPECYGEEMCSFFVNGQIRLTWFSYFLSVFNPKLSKLVYHGIFNDSDIIIKRKSGKNDDLQIEDENVESVILCSKVDVQNFLFGQIKGGVENKTMWLDLSNSVEPLLLMLFGNLQGNWPLPQYVGACGDLILEEHKGQPLSSYLTSDFKTRSQLSIQLLEMADIFTFGLPDVAFYFTDYSLDNLVVDSNKRVFLIDLDNVIIANKSAIENKNAHQSEILDELKYAFSPSDICSHYISDHNYFSICKYLLLHPEDGLLRDVPKNIKRRKKLLELLNECTMPIKTNDRFSAGQKLLILLQEIVTDLM